MNKLEQKEYNRQYYLKNRKQLIENNTIYQRKNRSAHLVAYKKYHEKCKRENPNLVKFKSLRFRANRNKLPFDLVFDELVWPEVCPVLGIPLDSRDRNHIPSFDRLIPSKGYTKENVRID